MLHRNKYVVFSLNLVFSAALFGQSSISGDIAGTISDPSGAVVPAAKVDLKSIDTGATQSSATNQNGQYRFSLLKPGRYSVSINLAGFQTAERVVDVNVGQVATVDLTLAVASSTQTVEVTEAIALLNPEASSNTAFSPREVELLPSAGGDITNIAFTAPGVVVALNNSYGNFSVNGLPGTSNLFTINGENYMDPYFNISNSGATNLSLGQNEVQEATVMTNPYSAAFGTFSGAQVNYVTKSGTNEFHGNAQYWWNGRFMNANDWFNNYYGADRPFSNANQWASNFGGPIVKNKTFFFVDTEGLRFVLPNVDQVIIPTQAFSNAVLTNVQNLNPSEVSAYKQMFNLWQTAPGAANATPLANSSACKTLSLPGFNAAQSACAATYQATPTALASEWILTTKLDQKIGDRDNASFRWRGDHGTQPTTIDPINSAFNAISSQPQWDTQFTETHIFGPLVTNQFLASLSHYVAQFQQDHAAAEGAFPMGIITSGSVPFTSFNEIYNFPQGRNITQYQFVDDINMIHGSHNLKFGVNYRRYDVSDHTFYFSSPAVYYGYTNDGLQKFANGLAYQYRQSLNLSNDVPIALWGLGTYFNDDWRIGSHFKLTLGLRIERNSNPVCQFNCFANFKSSWATLASATSASPGSVPYSSDIASGQHQAFPGVDGINWSPRIGFSWSPGNDNKTVVSGGFGLFYDPLAAGIVDDFLGNPPVSVPIRVRPSAGIAPFDPGPTGGPAVWRNSASAFSLDQTYSQLTAKLAALGSVFAAPSFTSVAGTLHAPRVAEWNLQVQRELTSTLALTLNYAGNHSENIPYSNSWLNAYDLYQIYPGVNGVAANPAVPNYGTVTQIQSGAISNYDGLSVSLHKRFSQGLQAHFNYTWSHALDEVSNGGVFGFNDTSLLQQLNPGSLRTSNYGNADYDIRHNFNVDFTYEPKIHFESRFANHLVNDWQFSGKVFWRSGVPFSVLDANTALGNYGGSLLAIPISGVAAQTSCGSGAANTPCVNANAFLNGADLATYPGLSSQTRNQYRGPNFFDADASVFRNFKYKERVTLAVGLTAFNAFNHPNFALPVHTMGADQFGQVTSMATTPTSPYGNFLGFDSSPRVVQLTARVRF